MADEAMQGTNLSDNDILFECPSCGKSLAIDQRGAGLTITCPGCSSPLRVPDLPGLPEAAPAGVPPPEPGEPAETRIAALTEALAGSQEKVARLVASLEELRNRRSYLEKLRAENMSRFNRIGKELVVVQNALDRIVAMLQDAASEGTEPAAPAIPVEEPQ